MVSMVIGDCGVAGLHAILHAVVVYSSEKGNAIIQSQKMVGVIVLVTTFKEKIVTPLNVSHLKVCTFPTLRKKIAGPIHGGWSDWNPWECYCLHLGGQHYILQFQNIVSTCYVMRRRFCNNPEPSNQGNKCSGKDHEYNFDHIVKSTVIDVREKCDIVVNNLNEEK